MLWLEILKQPGNSRAYGAVEGRLAAIRRGKRCSMLAPLHSDISLGQYIDGIHLFPRLRLQHIDDIIRFNDKVRQELQKLAMDRAKH